MSTSGVIRVEIDEFAGLLNGDELKKPVEIGDVEWTFGAFSETSKDTNNVRHLGLELQCNKNLKSNLWKVSATLKFKLCAHGSADPTAGIFSDTFNVEFSSNRKSMKISNFVNWQEATSPENGYVVDDTAVVEAHIEVETIQGIHVKNQIMLFDEPNENMMDLKLVVEGKNVYVGCQILALHSKFFYDLCHGGNSQQEIIVEDVSHSDFIRLLNLIYKTRQSIETSNIGSLLMLADRFGIPCVMQMAETFLLESKEIHLVDKLKYAELYRLSVLQSNCLSQLKTPQEVLQLSKHERYGTLGTMTSDALFHKISELMAIQNEKSAPESEDSDF